MPRKPKTVKTISNPDGVQIPVADLAKSVVTRDKIVTNLFRKARIFEEQLEKFRNEVDHQVGEYLKSVAHEYNEKWQGNTVLYNYSQTLSIEVSISKKITFDERLQIAKKKIDSCINSWSDDSNRNLKTLVMHAFQVDQKGDLNTKLILSLRQYQIADEAWKEAMDLISDAVLITSTKRYYIFRYAGEDGSMIPITLNFSRFGTPSSTEKTAAIKSMTSKPRVPSSESRVPAPDSRT